MHILAALLTYHVTFNARLDERCGSAVNRGLNHLGCLGSALIILIAKALWLPIALLLTAVGRGLWRLALVGAVAVARHHRRDSK
jgi:hypothetical protein